MLRNKTQCQNYSWSGSHPSLAPASSSEVVEVVVGAPLPQHLPGLLQNILDKLWVRLRAPTASTSTPGLNFQRLSFFLAVGLGLLLGAGQVGQLDGGDFV